MKIKILAAGIALTLPFWACAKDVTIIYTNDLHAHVEPYKVPWIADGKRDIGGWANITTLVKQEKAKNKATWFFDAGDYFTGPYISSLTKGKAIIDIMNTMPFDAVTIGNHEFDHGWDNTLLQLSQAKFPIVVGWRSILGCLKHEKNSVQALCGAGLRGFHRFWTILGKMLKNAFFCALFWTLLIRFLRDFNILCVCLI